MKLIIASNNANKVKEIKQILGAYFDEILSLKDIGANIDVVEDGDTFEANARKKAEQTRAYLDADAVLSDDSGLSVDALGGAPGVYSARYAGEGHNDAENNAKLLKNMETVPDDKRACSFVCAAALARRTRDTIIARGSVEGKLLRSPVGDNGFGYDPLFYYEPLKRSFAQLSSEEKNSLSHRANALIELRKMLESEKSCS